MTSAALTRPSLPRAVWDRPASDSRLLPKSSPYIVSLLNTPSGDGRSLDSTRHALLQGKHCRDNAPLTGRVYVAGIDLAGESQQPAIGGTRAIEPSRDSTVVTIGELRFIDDGLGYVLPSISVVEHYWWTGKPHTETPSISVRLLRHVWGFSRTATDALHPPLRTNSIGAGVVVFPLSSPGPSIAFPFAAPSLVAASLVGALTANHPSPSTQERSPPDRPSPSPTT